MSDSKRVILCADDFALNETVCAGIVQLVEENRLSAVSCFSDSPLWPAAAQKLLPYADPVALGLHFNLTEPFGHGERPLAFWIASSVAGRIDASAIREHLRRQLERFRSVVGSLPTFIDGHQHVHAFPHIRSAVRDVVDELRAEKVVRLRDVSSFFGSTDAPVKRFIIRTLARLGPEAPPQGAYFNSAMSGDYSLTADADYPGLFAQWLAEAPEDGLIMCHPAVESLGDADQTPSVGARELGFLRSKEFSELLDRYGIRLHA